MEAQSLTRVPSLKNMKSLRVLALESNKITRIEPGDFTGATQLVSINLAGNLITSVAAAGFTNLEGMRFKPDDFNPTNVDGTPFHIISVGSGLWKHSGPGYFGGGEVWSLAPVAYAPNPVECTFVPQPVNPL